MRYDLTYRLSLYLSFQLLDVYRYIYPFEACTQGVFHLPFQASAQYLSRLEFH